MASIHLSSSLSALLIVILLGLLEPLGPVVHEAAVQHHEHEHAQDYTPDDSDVQSGELVALGQLGEGRGAGVAQVVS